MIAALTIAFKYNYYLIIKYSKTLKNKLTSQNPLKSIFPNVGEKFLNVVTVKKMSAILIFVRFKL